MKQNYGSLDIREQDSCVKNPKKSFWSKVKQILFPCFGLEEENEDSQLDIKLSEKKLIEVHKSVAFNNPKNDTYTSPKSNESHIRYGGHRMLFQMDSDLDETASSSSGDVGVDLTGEYECFKGSIVFYPDANLYHCHLF